VFSGAVVGTVGTVVGTLVDPLLVPAAAATGLAGFHPAEVAVAVSAGVTIGFGVAVTPFRVRVPGTGGATVPKFVAGVDVFVVAMILYNSLINRS
jgi:hypothetical protein